MAEYEFLSKEIKIQNKNKHLPGGTKVQCRFNNHSSNKMFLSLPYHQYCKTLKRIIQVYNYDQILGCVVFAYTGFGILFARWRWYKYGVIRT